MLTLTSKPILFNSSNTLPVVSKRFFTPESCLDMPVLSSLLRRESFLVKVPGSSKFRAFEENEMAKKRDYKEEYRRRIERGLKRGLSRSQARGHARAGEQKSSAIRKPIYDQRLEEGLKAIRKGGSLTKSAQSVGVSPKTLRQYVQKTGVAYKSKNRWQIGYDP